MSTVGKGRYDAAELRVAELRGQNGPSYEGAGSGSATQPGPAPVRGQAGSESASPPRLFIGTPTESLSTSCRWPIPKLWITLGLKALARATRDLMPAPQWKQRPKVRFEGIPPVPRAPDRPAPSIRGPVPSGDTRTGAGQPDPGVCTDRTRTPATSPPCLFRQRRSCRALLTLPRSGRGRQLKVPTPPRRTTLPPGAAGGLCARRSARHLETREPDQVGQSKVGPTCPLSARSAHTVLPSFSTSKPHRKDTASTRCSPRP
jgi:hypothetical protein